MITATSLTVGSSANSGNSAFNTASVAPGANKLIILAVESFLNSGSVNTPTATGAGMTWTQIGTQLSSNNMRITLFRALSASPGSGAVTIDHAGQTQIQCSWSITEVDGIDQSGSNGAGAIVQSAGTGATSPNTSITVTLGAFSDGNNATFGYEAQQASTPVTVGSGFTQLSSISGNHTCVTEFRNDNDTTVDWTWSDDGGQQKTAMALELKTNVIDDGDADFI